MNVIIDPQLIKDAAEIEKGIEFIENQMHAVINKYGKTSEHNQKEILEKYMDFLKETKMGLVEFLVQQKEMEKLFSDAEKEINEIQDYNKELVSKYQLDPGVLD